MKRKYPHLMYFAVERGLLLYTYDNRGVDHVVPDQTLHPGTPAAARGDDLSRARDPFLCRHNLLEVLQDHCQLHTHILRHKQHVHTTFNLPDWFLSPVLEPVNKEHSPRPARGDRVSGTGSAGRPAVWSWWTVSSLATDLHNTKNAKMQPHNIKHPFAILLQWRNSQNRVSQFLWILIFLVSSWSTPRSTLVGWRLRVALLSSRRSRTVWTFSHPGHRITATGCRRTSQKLTLQHDLM